MVAAAHRDVGARRGDAAPAVATARAAEELRFLRIVPERAALRFSDGATRRWLQDRRLRAARNRTPAPVALAARASARPARSA